MSLLERYAANPEDPALRREVDDHVRTVLHDIVPALGPSFSREGVGVGKREDGVFELQANIRHRTKKLRSDLALVFAGFRPDKWPTHGPLDVRFRIDAFAGGTATQQYEYTSEDEADLRALAALFANDGYVLSDAAASTLVGVTRFVLCTRPLDLSAESVFASDAATALAAMIAAEHERLTVRVQHYVRSRR